MEKQITTVYVPTEKGKRFMDMLCNDVGCISKQAYLYTPEEHASVQGYREALEKIAVLTHYYPKDPQRAFYEISRITAAALSKAEDKEEGVRTFDGCLTCVHNIDTFEGNSFCIHNCDKGSRYELDVCKVQSSRTPQLTNKAEDKGEVVKMYTKEQYFKQVNFAVKQYERGWNEHAEFIKNYTTQPTNSLYVKETLTDQVFKVWKYIKSNDGEVSVWCNDWYGRHVIGQDCEFSLPPKP